MDSFFDPPPQAPEPYGPRTRYRSKPWHGPPPATIPATVAVGRVLARTEDVAVAVTALQVYPAGLQLELLTFRRPEVEHRAGEHFDPLVFHHPRTGTALSDDVLRLGVAFADGRKATNLAHEFGFTRPADDGIVLRSDGGGGGGERYAQTYWIWPIPSRGPLTVVCEWPSYGVPVTRLDLDGDAIRDAAGRATVIFSEDHLPEEPDEPADGPHGDGGWSRYVTGP